jgi:hypothetical protein
MTVFFPDVKLWLTTTGSTPQRPVLCSQIGNSLEFTRVVRYQSQAEAPSMGRNEKIVGTESPCPSFASRRESLHIREMLDAFVITEIQTSLTRVFLSRCKTESFERFMN